jgi:hypothetical protein
MADLRERITLLLLSQDGFILHGGATLADALASRNPRAWGAQARADEIIKEFRRRPRKARAALTEKDTDTNG